MPKKPDPAKKPVVWSTCTIKDCGRRFILADPPDEAGRCFYCSRGVPPLDRRVGGKPPREKP